MSLVAKQGGGQDFDPIPEGIYQGVCTALVDLGTQWNERFNKSNRKVAVTWEVPEERLEVQKDGTTKNAPRVITKMYTNSLGDKANLRRDLESWRGKSFSAEELEGFDLTKLVGANATLQILHNVSGDRVYANVSNIMPLHKATPKLEPESPTTTYSIEADGLNIPETVPEWLKKIIMKSEEMESRVAPHDSPPTTPPPAPGSQALEAMDDVPF